MIEIQLTRGYIALIDDEDRWVTAVHWHVQVNPKTVPYAIHSTEDCDGVKKSVLLHRVILGVTGAVTVDHINGNGLDCRRANLRVATHAQNLCNRGKQRNNTSGFKGVAWEPRRNRWRAKLNAAGIEYWGGLHDTPEDAARAYDVLARKIHGEFAHTNFPLKSLGANL
jgi:hypothetical protein